MEKYYKELKPKELTQQITRIVAFLSNNTDLMEEVNAITIAKMTDTDESIVKRVIEGELRPKSTKASELLLDKNYSIIAKGKEMILKNIDKIDPEKFQDLKALSDILDTSFKQNRLIEGKSTENNIIGIADIYDSVIGNATS